jgi:hypothetical protein
MMSPEIGQAAFRLGMIILLPALWLLLFVVRPGTVAFAVTVLAAIVGGILLAVVAILAKVFSS